MHLTTEKFIGMTSDASKYKQLMHTSRIHNICNVFFWKYHAWSKVCKIIINATNCLQLCCRHSFPIKYVINEHQYRVTTTQHACTIDFCPKTLQFNPISQVTLHFSLCISVDQANSTALSSTFVITEIYRHKWHIWTKMNIHFANTFNISSFAFSNRQIHDFSTLTYVTRLSIFNTVATPLTGIKCAWLGSLKKCLYDETKTQHHKVTGLKSKIHWDRTRKAKAKNMHSKYSLWLKLHQAYRRLTS